jgi:predicted signal transduction protein with EAL and GGDEF domain
MNRTPPPTNNFISATKDPYYLIIAILVAFVVFLLMREVVAWYRKTNEIISLLKDIKENTSKNASIDNKAPQPPTGRMIK